MGITRDAMKTTRRGFLKLLGLGGAAAATGAKLVEKEKNADCWSNLESANTAAANFYQPDYLIVPPELEDKARQIMRPTWMNRVDPGGKLSFESLQRMRERLRRRTR
jgi:hypothetical protein